MKGLIKAGAGLGMLLSGLMALSEIQCIVGLALIIMALDDFNHQWGEK